MREPACGCKACACGTATKLHLAWSTAAAAVNMMTFESTRTSQERRTLAVYHGDTPQALRRVAEVVVVTQSAHVGNTLCRRLMCT